MSGTRQKTLGEQLSQTLVAEGRGEALDAEAEDAEPLMAKPASESPALAEQLMEEVCDRGNLERAWKRVRSNKGSPGVDGMTIDAAKDYLREHWPNIRAQLLEGTYQPQPVKRVEIPKPDGGIRKLGVPCVVDRLIQQAMLQVLQERWDPTFSEHSYGFRPGRSAHQAVAQAQRYIADGYNVVVDLDLEKFFDQVNHDSLMASLRTQWRAFNRIASDEHMRDEFDLDDLFDRCHSARFAQSDVDDHQISPHSKALPGVGSGTSDLIGARHGLRRPATASRNKVKRWEVAI